MRIVITVAGHDRVGIVYDIASVCKQMNINIVDINQKVLSGTFSMVMLGDIEEGASFADVASAFEKQGEALGLTIHTMREEIFNAMHRI